MDTGSKPVIPSITGYPQLDTLLRGAIIAGSSYLTARCIDWMNLHHLTNSDLQITVGGAILSSMILVATLVWGQIQTRLNKLSAVQHVITAAATGTISDEVKVAAIKAPSISEVEITKALNNAEVLKGQVQ